MTKANRNILVLACVAVAVLAAIPLGLPLVLDVDGDDLSRDIADTARLPWWTGALSLLALMLWAAAAAICALTALAIKGREPERSRFLFGTAALLVAVAVDDALQLHETVAPEELGVPESAADVVLALAASLWLASFWRQVLATRVWVLGLSVVFFAGSLLSDVLVIGPTAAEDWLKNSGIAILLLWCGDTALQALRAAEATPGDALSEPRPRRGPAGATPPPAR
jgi:hypothetical protein